MAAMNTDPPVIDRLSLLSDDIICYILSFLSTKEAVVTSVLSKRYSYPFASVATIDLDYGLFWSFYKLEFGIAEIRFTKFMNKMLNSKPRINKFRIGFGAAVDAFPIRTSLANSWILEAIKRNVKILDIGYRIPFIDSENSVFLPNELFHCRTLVSLKLVITHEIKVPEHVDMPNLKELDVRFLQNLSPDFITISLHNLFTGCPLLEDLRLSSCICQDFISGGHVIFISKHFLKKLKLHWYGIMPIIIVNAPNLLHFDSSIETKIDIKMKILNCHVNDRITISPISSKLRGCSLLIDGAFRVKSLSLQVYRRQMGWFFAQCSLPKFPMLKHLELLGATNDYWESLFILDSMPALECLVIDLDYMRRGREHIAFHVPLNTPICFYQSLKEVEFRNFCGHQNDFALVQYILQHDEALTRMTVHLSKERDPIKHGSCSRLIRCGCHSRSIQSVCDELLALTMSSKICKIVFT